MNLTLITLPGGAKSFAHKLKWSTVNLSMFCNEDYYNKVFRLIYWWATHLANDHTSVKEQRDHLDHQEFEIYWIMCRSFLMSTVKFLNLFCISSLSQDQSACRGITAVTAQFTHLGSLAPQFQYLQILLLVSETEQEKAKVLRSSESYFKIKWASKTT